MRECYPDKDLQRTGINRNYDKKLSAREYKETPRFQVRVRAVTPKTGCKERKAKSNWQRIRPRL